MPVEPGFARSVERFSAGGAPDPSGRRDLALGRADSGRQARPGAGQLSNARVRAALDAAGVPWLALSPADLPAIKRDIDQVARACGATEDGQAAQRAFAASLAAAASARPQGERRPRVYLELDVAGAKAWTTGGDAFTSALVAAAGGDNVFANLRGWPQIGTEAIVAADPDVVLLAWPAAGPAGGSSQLGNVPAGRTGVMADAQSAARAFAARPGLLGLRAVRMGRIHRLDPALLGRPGPRAPAAVAAIAAVLSSPPAAALETP